MQISHEDTGNKGSFFIKESDKLLAEMTYSVRESNIMTIDHTWVDDSLQGKKVGNALVEKGVAFARAHHYKVIPLCTFAKKVFTKNAMQYSDILKE